VTVTEWFQFIQDNQNDTVVARRLLESLFDYRRGGPMHTPNVIEVSALLAAIRLDQMAKENRA
jgi:hypothetical protein